MTTELPEQAGLWVCATPIGNLDDVSDRLRAVLASVDVIACEDTRRTRALLSALGIAAPRLLSHRLDNERASVDGVLSVLESGARVALVSDAGTPGVSDPGAMLVRAAHDASIPVHVIAGPSSIAAALSVAGCVAVGHTFVGFLPRSSRDVQQLLRHHAHEVVVGLESPQRITSSVQAVAAVQPARRVVIARELTKLHEEVLTGDAESIAAQLAQREIRGEVVVVFDALPHEQAVVTPRLLDLVHAIVAEGVRMKQACRIVAEYAEVSARDLYARMVKSDTE